MDNHLDTGHQDRTNASFDKENIIAFHQDPLSPYAKEEYSLLNVPIVKGLIKFPSLPIPDATPKYAYERLHKLFARTVRVLSKNIPHIPCWIYTGSCDPDGYARHNPKKLTEVEEGYSSDSALVHRYVYQYLYMPSGIPTYCGDGKTLWNVHHKCGRGYKGCIHPQHLQLLDRPTNIDFGNMDNL